MASKRKSNKLAKRSVAKGSAAYAHESPHESPLDLQLVTILFQLSQLLLRSGYGFPRLNELAKVAFVDAAKASSGNPLQAASIARIATITGLTRLDVSKIVRADRPLPSKYREQPNRAARVAQGWLSDQEFRNDRGRPKTLPFLGKRGSFTALVKRYSGDIPPRAMLAEMMRLRMVRQPSSGMLRMIRHKITPSKSLVSTISAIAPWVTALAEAHDASRSAKFTSAAHSLTIQFESLPQVHAALRELGARRDAFIQGLKELGTVGIEGSAYVISVSAAVATSEPIPSNKTT